MTDDDRKRWNAGQQKWRRALSAKCLEAIGLVLEQNAIVHAGNLSGFETGRKPHHENHHVD